MAHPRLGGIGRGLRISAALLALLLVGGGAFWLVTRNKKAPEEVKVTEIAAPAAADTSREATVPAVRFTDVTEKAGIRFNHENGANGDKLLPETMGGGTAWFDYDGDQLPDLLLVDSGTARFAESNSRSPGLQQDSPRIVPHGLIFAEAGTVTLRAGDGVRTDANSEVFSV